MSSGSYSDRNGSGWCTEKNGSARINHKLVKKGTHNFVSKCYSSVSIYIQCNR